MFDLKKRISGFLYRERTINLIRIAEIIIFSLGIGSGVALLDRNGGLILLMPLTFLSILYIIRLMELSKGSS